MTVPFRRERACRACGSDALLPVIDFGEMPLADRLIDEADGDSLSAPMTLAHCPACGLVQILETVAPDILFGQNYPYFSSVSTALAAHFRDSALARIAERGLGASSLVVEAACNDGVMLRHFAERGIPVLGIDPAGPPVAAARALGLPVQQSYFGEALARHLRREHPRGADLFLANNVLAHVEDLNGFVRGIVLILGDAGQAVLEVPYLADLLAHSEFDTIYHQHLCYFSVGALCALFARHDLCLNRVERLAIHGGSLRLFVQSNPDGADGSVEALLQQEAAQGLDTPLPYRLLADRMQRLRQELRGLVESLRNQGARIAGYGAAAKATTLLAYCGLGLEHLDFIADRNPYKQGRFMPGSGLPIVPPERLCEAMPDYVLILAWNFAEKIMNQLEAYRHRGGRFILPIPWPGIVMDESA